VVVAVAAGMIRSNPFTLDKDMAGVLAQDTVQAVETAMFGSNE